MTKYDQYVHAENDLQSELRLIEAAAYVARMEAGNGTDECYLDTSLDRIRTIETRMKNVYELVKRAQQARREWLAEQE